MAVFRKYSTCPEQIVLREQLQDQLSEQSTHRLQLPHQPFRALHPHQLLNRPPLNRAEAEIRHDRKYVPYVPDAIKKSRHEVLRKCLHSLTSLKSSVEYVDCE